VIPQTDIGIIMSSNDGVKKSKPESFLNVFKKDEKKLKE
jgi:hypothetical protein